MKPFKGYFTEATFKIANLVPFIFPKWLREIAKYHRDPEEYSIYKNEDEIRYGSFLEGDFLWKAVSVTVQLNQSDLEALNRWMKKSASPMYYNHLKDFASFKMNYDSGGIFL